VFEIANSNSIDVKIAATATEKQLCIIIRSAVFIGELGSPIEEEFDLNDECSAHLIAYHSGEPAAVLRIRCFNGFAKMERFAVLKQFRTSEVRDHLMRCAIEYCRAKGYGSICVHAQGALVRLWRRYGFKHGGQPGFRYSKVDPHEYQSLWLTVPPAERGLDGGDPIRLNRPEGSWDRPWSMEAGV
jgi:predicted GNAT family N-acyltransferase